MKVNFNGKSILMQPETNKDHETIERILNNGLVVGFGKIVQGGTVIDNRFHHCEVWLTNMPDPEADTDGNEG
jgi:hypothetical protein